jgi:hypothetical protein
VLGFLLEGVQHIDRLGESDRVDSAKGTAIEVVNNFKHNSTAETSQWLRVGRLTTNLRFPQRATDA